MLKIVPLLMVIGITNNSMRDMKKSIFIISLMALAVSCAKEKLNDVIEEGSYKLTAIVESVNGTKTSIFDNGNATFSHKWEVSDAISVFDGSENQKFTTSGSGSSVSFSGNPLSTAAPHYVVYPYSASNSISGNVVTVTYPATQVLREGNYAAGSNIMVGLSDSKDIISFKNACAYIQLNFAQKASTVIKKIEITAVGGEVICGTADITIAGDGTITNINMTGDGKIITVDCGAGLDISASAKTVYVPLPAVNLSNGFQVVVRAADYSSMGVKTTNTTVVSRNTVTKMPALDYVGTKTAYGVANTILAYNLSSLNIDVTAHPVVKSAFDDWDPIAVDINDVSKKKVEAIPVKAEILWKEPGITALSIEPEITNNIVKVTNIAGLGNALIAIKDANDNIIWSYTIWKPEVDPTLESNLIDISSSYKMMPMDLGAINYSKDPISVVESTDTKFYGLWFHYGSKNPISHLVSVVWRDGVRGLNDASCSTYTALIAGETEYKKEAAMYNSHKNPTLYYKGWKNEDYSWNRTKKTYTDPCPEGYKIMNSNHFQGAGFAAEYISNGWLFKKNDVNLLFTPKNMTLRDEGTDVSFPNTTNSGALYVGSASNNLKSAIYFTSPSIIYNTSVSGACFVRCEKIK